MKRAIHVSAVLIAVAVILAGVLAGTVTYYNGVLEGKNSKIASLNTQIGSLTSQGTNLTSAKANPTSQLTNLTSANLVAELGVSEVSNTSSISRSYNRLFIEGSVTDNGQDEALNAGVHVLAYAADGTLEINMTIPLTHGEFGTNEAIYSYICSFDPYCASSPKLGNLSSGQSADVNLDIYHEGTVTNWTVTPVWTEIP
jgi:hypothetical protein